MRTLCLTILVCAVPAASILYGTVALAVRGAPILVDGAIASAAPRIAFALGLALLLGIGTGLLLLARAPLHLALHLREAPEEALVVDQQGLTMLGGGWRLLVPWESVLSVTTRPRRDGGFRIVMKAERPIESSPGPGARLMARQLLGKGLQLPCTATDPTEDELAQAIAVRSGGRVTVRR